MKGVGMKTAQEDNKKKIERMLSEDITSFKQAINFIVRH